MEITSKQFEQFWKEKGQYLRLKNPSRFMKNLSKKIDECKNPANLDDYVCSMKNDKETTRKVIVDFYSFLEEKNGKKVDSKLYTKVFYDYPFERQLEIAKFLHEKKTITEITEKFDIDARTARADLSQLEYGITVLGSTIQIEKEKEGRNYYYKTTLHPIFLPLNLTEVYALTVYLNNEIKDYNVNATIIRDISERVKSQLSDYALEKLNLQYRANAYDNHYINDEMLARQREGIYCYLMKSGQKCKFFWNGKEYYGGIRFINDEYKIALESGEILNADLKEVDFLVDQLEYM